MTPLSPPLPRPPLPRPGDRAHHPLVAVGLGVALGIVLARLARR